MVVGVVVEVVVVVGVVVEVVVVVGVEEGRTTSLPAASVPLTSPSMASSLRVPSALCVMPSILAYERSTSAGYDDPSLLVPA